MNHDQTGFGAFDGECIVGFAIVSRHAFGETANYVELVSFQVSEEYRRRGIGRSSKESQAAYQALGCKHAEEINKVLAEKEPFDVQLEYVL